MKHGGLLWLFCSLHAGLAADRIHVVQPGERVPRLEMIYGVPAGEIRTANGLDSDSLEPGMRIRIPNPATAPVPETRRAIPHASPSPAASVPGTHMASDATNGDPSESAYRAAIALPASRGLRYNGKWTPPGETSLWSMDCSNTVRWLVRHVRGVDLPRTASDQYEFLKKNRRLWRSRPDAKSLGNRLKPGDLLFWEHTYRPVRKPPVTHVMVYLGADSRGQMWMAGSQSSRGPGIYRFNPDIRMGGYPFFLFFKREGRFVAFARP